MERSLKAMVLLLFLFRHGQNAFKNQYQSSAINSSVTIMHQFSMEMLEKTGIQKQERFFI